MEEELLLKEIFMKSPCAFGFHKIVCNNQGQPEDNIFLDANPAFEELTGLKKEAILGERVTEVLPGIRSGGFDWVSFYGNVALNGGTQKISKYAEPLQRWYKVTVFSPQKGYLSPCFRKTPRKSGK